MVAEPAGELRDGADPRQWLGEVLYRLHDIGDDPTGLVGAQPDDEAERRTSSQGADTIKVDASRRSQMRFDAGYGYDRGVEGGREIMHYAFLAIPEEEVPQAAAVRAARAGDLRAVGGRDVGGGRPDQFR